MKSGEPNEDKAIFKTFDWRNLDTSQTLSFSELPVALPAQV